MAPTITTPSSSGKTASTGKLDSRRLVTSVKSKAAPVATTTTVVAALAGSDKKVASAAHPIAKHIDPANPGPVFAPPAAVPITAAPVAAKPTAKAAAPPSPSPSPVNPASPSEFRKAAPAQKYGTVVQPPKASNRGREAAVAKSARIVAPVQPAPTVPPAVPVQTTVVEPAKPAPVTAPIDQAAKAVPAPSTSPSPPRRSADHSTSFSRLASNVSGAGSTTRSRLDACESHLRATEDLWAAHMDEVRSRRDAVRAEAKRLEDEYRKRAEEQLQREASAEMKCRQDGSSQWNAKLQEKHVIEELHREAVERAKKQQEQFQAELDDHLRVSLSSAAKRYSGVLTDRSLRSHEGLSSRFSRLQSNQQQMDEMSRKRESQRLEHERSREAKARQLQHRARSRSADWFQREANRLAVARSRHEEFTSRRLELSLEAQRREEERAAAALQAHREALSARGQRKASKERQAIEAVARSKSQFAEYQDWVAHHFEETLKIGEATRQHNAKCHTTTAALFASGSQHRGRSADPVLAVALKRAASAGSNGAAKNRSTSSDKRPVKTVTTTTTKDARRPATAAPKANYETSRWF